MIDPTGYLGVVDAVINSLNIPYHIRDEAYSEGLVALTRAASSFDSQRGAQPNTWFTIKLRYALLAWLTEENKHRTVSLDALSWDGPGQERADQTLMLAETVAVCVRCLTREEHTALIAPAWGLEPSETERLLSRTKRQLKRLRTNGRAKLRNQLGML